MEIEPAQSLATIHKSVLEKRASEGRLGVDSRAEDAAGVAQVAQYLQPHLSPVLLDDAVDDIA